MVHLYRLYPGQHNHNAGPDFHNAKIKIDGTLWVGNVEIHVHQSDWTKHGHQRDPKYKNIILHVCYFYDQEIPKLNKLVPTLVLNGNIRPSLLNKYQKLNNNRNWIPCEKLVNPRILIEQMPLFSYPLVLTRIERKCKELEQVFELNKSDWEASTYSLIAKSFGSKVNKFGFEQLATATPHKILIKHASKLFQLEALLLGQAALLPEKSEEKYIQELIKEYQFLKKKYSLKPINKEVWNYSKLRPANFPDIKIVQWANFIHQHPQACALFLSLENIDDFLKITSLKASQYWDTHYRIGAKSITRKKVIGKGFLNLLFINAVVPLIFYHGKINDNAERTSQALKILEQIPAESNSIIKKWKNLGFKAENALESQALLELKNEYCDKIACLKCRIGMKLLNS